MTFSPKYKLVRLLRRKFTDFIAHIEIYFQLFSFFPLKAVILHSEIVRMLK